MKISSLEEKYNRSKKLGYIPRQIDSLYPSFSEEKSRSVRNSQSFENAYLSSFTAKSNEGPLRTNYTREYKSRIRPEQTFTKGYKYKKNCESPIKQYKNSTSENIHKYRNVYDSPIKQLPIPTITPTRIKPHSIYKGLDVTPNNGSISKNTKKQNSRIHKTNAHNSRDQGIFSKLRNYLNNFSLYNIESKDSNLKDLRLSARNISDVPIEPKKIQKKVSFEENDLNIEKQNGQSQKQDTNLDNFSNIDEVDDILKENKTRHFDVAFKLREQLDDLREKHKTEVNTLNSIINNLKDDCKKIMESNKAKELMLEKQFDNNYKNIKAEHEEKQRELDQTMKEIERKRLILNQKEIEIESRLEKLNAFSINKMIQKNSNLNKQFYQNEYSELLQQRLSIRLKLEQNISDYARTCKKLNITLPLDTSRKPKSKYTLIIEKFKEYSKLLELPEFYKTMNLAEIEMLFNKLKQNLITSSFKKKSKSELLEEEILNIVTSYERNICSSYDVSRVFSKKNNLLVNLDLIYSLLIDLNSLFSQLNELIVKQELSIGSLNASNTISRF